MFHLVKRAIDVARLKFNPAAAIYDDVRVQSEVACSERAVLHAVIQCQPHQVNVLDRSLLQIISKTGFAPTGIGEKRAVAIDLLVDAFVENVSDS
jgi:hypothetical protein